MFWPLAAFEDLGQILRYRSQSKLACMISNWLFEANGSDFICIYGFGVHCKHQNHQLSNELINDYMATKSAFPSSCLITACGMIAVGLRFLHELDEHNVASEH